MECWNRLGKRADAQARIAELDSIRSRLLYNTVVLGCFSAFGMVSKLIRKRSKTKIAS